MKNYYLHSAKIIILGLVVGLGVSMISAQWQGPGSNPPSGNKEAPINVSTDPQAKGGAYITGTLLDINGLLTSNDLAVAGKTVTSNLDVLGIAKIESLSDAENTSATYPAQVCADVAGNLMLCTGGGGGPGPGPTQTAPQFTSSSPSQIPWGQAYSYTPTASGNPTPVIVVTSTLPSWLTFNGTTLSGTPGSSLSGQSFSVTFSATNGVSPNATQTINLTVVANGSQQWALFTTTNSLWTVPAGVNSVKISISGGAGGGGGAGGYSGSSGGPFGSPTYGAAGGGGGTGAVYSQTIAVAPGDRFRFVLGNGGGAGSTGGSSQDGANGGAGGTSKLQRMVSGSWTDIAVLTGGVGGKGGQKACLPGGSNTNCGRGGNGGNTGTGGNITAGSLDGNKGSDGSPYWTNTGIAPYGGGKGLWNISSNNFCTNSPCQFTAGGRGGDGMWITSGYIQPNTPGDNGKALVEW